MRDRQLIMMIIIAIEAICEGLLYTLAIKFIAMSNFRSCSLSAVLRDNLPRWPSVDPFILLGSQPMPLALAACSPCTKLDCIDV